MHILRADENTGQAVFSSAFFIKRKIAMETIYNTGSAKELFQHFPKGSADLPVFKKSENCVNAKNVLTKNAS